MIATVQYGRSVCRAVIAALTLALGACAESDYYTHSDAHGDGVYYTVDRHSRSRLYDDGTPSPYGWSLGYSNGPIGPWALGYVGAPVYGGWWDPWFDVPVVYAYRGPWRDSGHWRHRPYGDSRDFAPRVARDEAERAAFRRAPGKSGMNDGASARGRDWASDRGREPRGIDNRGHRERD